MVLRLLAQGVAAGALALLVTGIIQRTKSLWTGRRGPPLLQLAFDVARLCRKSLVYSETTTWIFRLAPWVVLVTSLISAFVAPILGIGAPLAFRFDFVWFAYVWGLGRLALMLGALDTGSSFEGMGASREATFSAAIEPAFFLLAGATCLVTGDRSFGAIIALKAIEGPSFVVRLAGVVVLFVLVQVECARMPVDDPTTHLELTMVHEVMILDHSGRDLAAMEVAAAAKLTVGLGVLATLLNPLAGRAPAAAVAAANVLLILLLAAVIGTIESLTARLRLRVVPQYIILALVAGGIALLATTWTGGPG
jgi:formate hydrogenlyase subunit 4